MMPRNGARKGRVHLASCFSRLFDAIEQIRLHSKVRQAFALVGKGHSRACPHLVALVDLSQRSHGHAVVDAAKD